MTTNDPVKLSIISLPEPQTEGGTSLTEAIFRRRSVREYVRRPISADQLSQLLWSVQGITGSSHYKRTPPSAGALHPFEIYVVIGEVTAIPSGVYRYLPVDHAIKKTGVGDIRLALGRAALDQTWLAGGSVVLVLAAVYERTTGKYGKRGIRYVHMDAGFAAENLHLQAVALGLASVVIGAFDDAEVHRVVDMDDDERPLLILPVGFSV
jgi:SagB-type dehydrogenase family enzyme